MPERIRHPDYHKDGIPRSEQVFVNRNKIAILTKEEQEAMRKVCRFGREVLDIAGAAIQPGVTTDFIDELVHNECIKRDVGQNSRALFKFCAKLHSRTHRH